MIRIAKWSLAVALGAMALGSAARAADDDGDLKALIADCGSPNIARDDIDSCLARARDISEEAPSAQLQGLTARLERRAEMLDEGDTMPSHPGQTQAAASPAPDGSGASSGGASVAANDSAAAPH